MNIRAHKAPIIIVSLFLILPLSAVGLFVGSCKVRANSIKTSNKEIINEFEQTKLIASDTSAAKVYLGGDCVDSQPYIQVDKKIQVNKPATQTIAEIQNSLGSQGFKITNEKVTYNKSCGYKYYADAKGKGIEFRVWFITYDESNPPDSCLSENPASVNDLNNVNVTALMARLKT
jgi:hypothetical protein